MELSSTAKEILVQAQMLMKETGGTKLCVEHLLYGVLELADYLEPPFDKGMYEEDGKRVRQMVEKDFLSIASAREQLKKSAKADRDRYVDGRATLGRASELTHGGQIGAEELTRAVLEKSTPVMESLKTEKNERYANKDARYHPEQIQEQNEEEKKSLTPSQAAFLAALIEAALGGQEIQPSGKRPQGKRRTKMGLFTYRGGKVAAIIQYFLFGILVPAALIFALDKFTGFLHQPHTPLVTFLGMAFVCFWAFYLGRGLALVFGIASSALGNFLDILLDLGLIASLVYAATLAWNLPEVPFWLRMASCIIALLVLTIGNANFENLRDNGNITKTRIFLSNEEGTPDKIFFHALTKMLYWPLLGFSIWWIWKIDLPDWAIKALWIVAFLMVYYIIWTGLVCHNLRYEKSRRHRKGARFAKFLMTFHLFMFIPELVLMLHWVFGWFPMKTWVMIVLGIYTLFFFISSIGVSRNA